MFIWKVNEVQNWDKKNDLNLNFGSDLVLIRIQNVSIVIYLASLSGWSEIFFRFPSLVFKNHSCCCKCHLLALYFSENYLIKIKFSCSSLLFFLFIKLFLFCFFLDCLLLLCFCENFFLFGYIRVVKFLIFIFLNVHSFVVRY